MQTQLLGKSELLGWASQQSAVPLPQCQKYDDLKDGYIFLLLINKIWPNSISAKVLRPQRRGARTSQLNWELIKSTFSYLQVPALHLCDIKLAGHQRSTYNLLVMLYFLARLSVAAEFSVDFVHPIDESIAAFLQSPASLECLQRGAQQQPPASKGAPEDIMETDSNSEQQHPHHHSNNNNRKGTSHAVVSALAAAAQEDRTSSLERRSVSPAHPATSPTRRPTTPRNNNVAPRHHSDPMADAASGFGGGGGGGKGEVVSLKAELGHLRRSKELLEEEVAHVKALGRHAVEQQRMLFEAELARSTGQHHSQLATVRLELEFEVHHAIARLKGDYDRILDELALERNRMTHQHETAKERDHQAASALRQTNAVLMGKLNASDSAITKLSHQCQQLKDALDQQRAWNEKLVQSVTNTAQRWQSAVHSDEAQLPKSLQSGLDAGDAPAVAALSGAVKQLALELRTARNAIERLEEDKKELVARASRGGGTIEGFGSPGGKLGEDDFSAMTDGSDEVLRLKSHVSRLQRANSFLHEELQVVRSARSSGSTLGNLLLSAGDDEGEVLPHVGLKVPAAQSIGVWTVDTILADLRRRWQQEQLQPTLVTTTTGGGDSGGGVFWELAVLAQVLAARNTASVKLVTTLSDMLLQAHQQTATAQHQHEADLRAKLNELDGRYRSQVASLQQKLDHANFTLSMTREESSRNRVELSNAFHRLQTMSAGLIAECERLLDGPRQTMRQLVMEIPSLQQRDGQWQQAVDALLWALHCPPSERQAATAKAEGLAAALNTASSRPNRSLDHDLAEALRQLDDHVRQAVQTVKAKLQDGLDDYMTSYDALRDLRTALCDRADEIGTLQAEAAVLQHRNQQLVQEAQDREAEAAQAAAKAAESTSQLHTTRMLAEAFQRNADQYVQEAIDGKFFLLSGGPAAAARPPQKTWQSVSSSISENNARWGPSSNGKGGVSTTTSSAVQQPYEPTTPPPPPPDHSRSVLYDGASSSSAMTASAGGGVSQPSLMARLSLPLSAPSSQLQGGSSTPSTSSILSPEELERRKQEILQKYGVRR